MGSSLTTSKAGNRTTLRERISFCCARRSSRVISLIGASLGSAGWPSVPHAVGSFSFISYGSGWGSTLPGVSTRVESTSLQSSSGFQLRVTINAVPRKSRMDFTDSPAARRCERSSKARSALPNKRISALESVSTERRTVSDQ